MDPLGRRVAWWWKPLENHNKRWCDFHAYASNLLLITAKCISATQFFKLKQSSRHINYHLLTFVSVWATPTLTFVDLIFGSSLMWRNSMCCCRVLFLSPQCFISTFFKQPLSGINFQLFLLFSRSYDSPCKPSLSTETVRGARKSVLRWWAQQIMLSKSVLTHSACLFLIYTSCSCTNEQLYCYLAGIFRVFLFYYWTLSL